MISGVDLSYAQTTTPPLDGLDFVVVKASQADFKDGMYDYHATAVRKAGLPLLAYHFGVVAATTPIATQVARFLASARSADYLFLDQEKAPDGTTMSDAEAQQFLDLIRKSRECGLYHSASGFGGTTGEDAQWVADYRAASVAAGYPRRMSDGVEFPGWDIWQYTSDGTQAGYTGKLDLNYMNPKSPLVQRLRVGYSDPTLLQATIDAQATIIAGLKDDVAAARLQLTSLADANEDLTAKAQDLQVKLDAAPAVERGRIAAAEAARINSI